MVISNWKKQASSTPNKMPLKLIFCNMDSQLIKSCSLEDICRHLKLEIAA